MKVFSWPYLVDEYFYSISVSIIAEDLESAIVKLRDEIRAKAPSYIDHHALETTHLQNNVIIKDVNESSIELWETWR
jgi:hypothetical protein